MTERPDIIIDYTFFDKKDKLSKQDLETYLILKEEVEIKNGIES